MLLFDILKNAFVKESSKLESDRFDSRFSCADCKNSLDRCPKHRVRLIAFYLPQFHPIPENDQWWGDGFTEWTNVKKSEPLFDGHYQPHIPGELGYYDLRQPEVREAQAALAKQYGVYGFCYYYYWFNGKRLLERPLNEVLESGRPDFPFCICWANGNWTRNWDGRHDEVLQEQTHSAEDDLAFITDLIPMFEDARYIRVNGKPLLLVYQADLLPDAKCSADIWQRAMIDAGVGELYLVRVESHQASGNPRKIGFDASTEFAAHDIPLDVITTVPALIKFFSGRMFSYPKYAKHSANKEPTAYTRFRGVMPSWDNTARVGDRAGIFIDSSPAVYQEWLSRALYCTRKELQGDERLIFINAWNEWGEGCHLEPDQKYGRQFLEATLTAMNQSFSD